jgi:hypothetical protein
MHYYNRFTKYFYISIFSFRRMNKKYENHEDKMNLTRDQGERKLRFKNSKNKYKLFFMHHDVSHAFPNRVITKNPAFIFIYLLR